MSAIPVLQALYDRLSQRDDDRIVIDVNAVHRDTLRSRSRDALKVLRSKMTRLKRIAALNAEMQRALKDLRAAQDTLRAAIRSQHRTSRRPPFERRAIADRHGRRPK